jgi:hypothetical protein
VGGGGKIKIFSSSLDEVYENMHMAAGVHLYLWCILAQVALAVSQMSDLGYPGVFSSLDDESMWRGYLGSMVGT